MARKNNYNNGRNGNTNNNVNNNNANNSQANSKQVVTCNFCGKNGHLEKDCRCKSQNNNNNGNTGNGNNNPQGACFFCKKNGHLPTNCKFNPQSSAALVCANCGGRGHFAKGCPNAAGSNQGNNQGNYNQGNNRQGNKNQGKTCNYCGKNGHVRDVCKARIKDESNGVFRQTAIIQNQNNGSSRMTGVIKTGGNQQIAQAQVIQHFGTVQTQQPHIPIYQQKYPFFADEDEGWNGIPSHTQTQPQSNGFQVSLAGYYANPHPESDCRIQRDSDGEVIMADFHHCPNCEQPAVDYRIVVQQRNINQMKYGQRPYVPMQQFPAWNGRW